MIGSLVEELELKEESLEGAIFTLSLKWSIQEKSNKYQ